MERGGWRAAAWLGLAIAGFAAALRLIDAPPAVAYQHYRVTAGDPARLVALATLAAQAVILLTVGWPHVVAALRWVSQSIRRTAIVLLALLLLATSVAPSKEPSVYAAEALFATVTQLFAALTLVAAASSLPDSATPTLRRLMNRLLGEPDASGPLRLDWWSLFVAGCVTGITALLAAVVYERHPHVPDEVVYLLQSRYLAQGMLTMPAPPVPAAFNLDLMQYEPTRWFSPVPPAWPFVLAAGAWIGAPWLVNPVLGGVAIVLAYLLLGEMYDRRTARLAVLLLAASPWFLFMTMNFMTHTFTLVCALGAALGVARARRQGAGLPAVLAGLCTGVLSLIRPLEGLIVALLLGAWSLSARGRPFRFGPSAMFVAGAVLAASLTFPYNRMLTGSASRMPIMAYIDKYYAPGSNDMGFGPNRGLGWPGLDPFPGHGIRDVGVNALLNASQVNVELLGWPTGTILVLGLLLALGRRQLSREDWWNLAAIAAVVAGHSFYWFSGGPDFGARYWYLILVPCIALAARAIQRLGSDVREGSREGRGGEVRASVLAVALMLLTLAVYVPWRSLGKYHHYRGMRADVRTLSRDHSFGESLVLVRGRRHPDYASAAVYNPVDLRAAAPIYAWDAAPEIRRLILRAYPERRVWILDGPSITGAGYRVAAGPLTPDEARATLISPSAAGDEAHVYDPVYPPPRLSRP